MAAGLGPPPLIPTKGRATPWNSEQDGNEVCVPATCSNSTPNSFLCATVIDLEEESEELMKDSSFERL